MTYKELSHRFEGRGPYRGMNFSCIKSSEVAYLYKIAVGGAIYYHVFKRRENTYYMTITYPRPEAFGKWAWCFYNNFKRALKKFNEINK